MGGETINRHGVSAAADFGFASEALVETPPRSVHESQPEDALPCAQEIGRARTHLFDELISLSCSRRTFKRQEWHD
jgi:hypothetical protein